jgi:hypothetical protein
MPLPNNPFLQLRLGIPAGWRSPLSFGSAADGIRSARQRGQSELRLSPAGRTNFTNPATLQARRKLPPVESRVLSSLSDFRAAFFN